jgi:hypothetical protein
MMKGLDVGSLSGRPRPGVALKPELAGVLWAKPHEAARIARSRAIAYTTRFPDGVLLRTETRAGGRAPGFCHSLPRSPTEIAGPRANLGRASGLHTEGPSRLAGYASVRREAFRAVRMIASDLTVTRPALGGQAFSSPVY